MLARRCLFATLFLCLIAAIGCATPSLVSITVTPDTETFIGCCGGTAQYKAIGTYRQGNHSTTQDITTTVTWSSNATSVATVSQAGVVTGVGYGASEITASGYGYLGLVQGTAQAVVCHPDPNNPDKCNPN